MYENSEAMLSDHYCWLFRYNKFSLYTPITTYTTTNRVHRLRITSVFIV